MKHEEELTGKRLVEGSKLADELQPDAGLRP